MQAKKPFLVEHTRTSSRFVLLHEYNVYYPALPSRCVTSFPHGCARLPFHPLNFPTGPALPTSHHVLRACTCLSRGKSSSNNRPVSGLNGMRLNCAGKAAPRKEPKLPDNLDVTLSEQASGKTSLLVTSILKRSVFRRFNSHRRNTLVMRQRSFCSSFIICGKPSCSRSSV